MRPDKLLIAVCDDERDIVTIVSNSVETILSSHHIRSDVKRFTNPKELLETLETTTYDLVFVDIDMPEMDGISLSKTIFNKTPKTGIIFVSNREDKVFESLEVRPLGFVRKNNFLSDINKIINQFIIECERNTDESSPKLTFQSEGKQLFIDIPEILYFECYDHEQIICLQDKKISIRSTMKAIEDKIVQYGFKRVHKGYIVNLKKIKAIVSDGVIMANDYFIPINRKKIAEFKHEYLKSQTINNDTVII